MGYPRFSANLTSMYTFSSGPLKGFKAGGTVRAVWDFRNYYYYENGINPGVARTLYSYPTLVQLDLIFGYSHRFKKFTFSTQVNIANALNEYQILVLPNASTGYGVTNALNATYSNQPRAVTWTTEIKF